MIDDKILIYTKQEERHKAGLSDGGHHLINCRNCNTPLVDVFITKPEINIELEILAECGICGDKSWQTKVKGGFHIGIAVVDNNGNIVNDDKDGRAYVSHESYDFDNDVVLIKTRKIE